LEESSIFRQIVIYKA